MKEEVRGQSRDETRARRTSIVSKGRHRSRGGRDKSVVEVTVQGVCGV